MGGSMYRNLKKMWPAAAASLVAITSLLNAADDAQVRNLENRVSALEQRRNSNGIINPNARPGVRNGSDLFVTADLLYMKAEENGLTYGIENCGSSENILNGKMKDPHFKWDFGFRVGVGYNLPHDGWDLYLDWTRLYSRAHASESDEVPSTIFATWANPQITGFNDIKCNEADAHWRLHLNVVDLELGREFFTSKWLTLRPFIGLRGAWIHQRYHVEYEDGSFFINNEGEELEDAEDGELDIRMKNNYWGVGLRGGLNTLWGLCGGWSIYGDLAISLLYGRFHVRQAENFIATGSDTKENQLYVDHGFTSGRAVTDLGLGLRWDHSFCDCNYHFGIQAGYEHHMFFGQNQLNRFVDDTVAGAFVSNLGDLTVQGWVLSARFDF